MTAGVDMYRSIPNARKTMSGKNKNKVITIVVPAYNEEKSIEQTIIHLRSISSKLKKINCQLKIFIVNDGSSDGTESMAIRAGADKIVKHKVNLGLGAAVRSGLGAAYKDGSDIAIKFDADLQHDPEDIIELIKPIIADEADIVYGMRFGNLQYKMPFMRRAGNYVFTKLMKFLTGWPLQDSQPGIFAVNRDYLEVFYIPGDYNYTQQILLDAYHKNMRFAHVPVTFRKRETGKSFVSLKYPFIVLFQILMLLIGVKPIKIFGSLGLFFLSLALVITAKEMTQWLFYDAIKPVVHVNAVSVLLMLGMQCFFFGLIAELIVRNNQLRR